MTQKKLYYFKRCLKELFQSRTLKGCQGGAATRLSISILNVAFSRHENLGLILNVKKIKSAVKKIVCLVFLYILLQPILNLLSIPYVFESKGHYLIYFLYISNFSEELKEIHFAKTISKHALITSRQLSYLPKIG